MKALSRHSRLRLLEDAAPPWIGRWILRHRFLLLTLLINLPGNSFIGGGILLAAGLRRLFSFPALVLVLATAPVPWAVWFLE